MAADAKLAKAIIKNSNLQSTAPLTTIKRSSRVREVLPRKLYPCRTLTRWSHLAPVAACLTRWVGSRTLTRPRSTWRAVVSWPLSTYLFTMTTRMVRLMHSLQSKSGRPQWIVSIVVPWARNSRRRSNWSRVCLFRNRPSQLGWTLGQKRRRRRVWFLLRMTLSSVDSIMEWHNSQVCSTKLWRGNLVADKRHKTL